MKRPTSVTVAAWVIMVMVADAFVGMSSSLIRPLLSQIADPGVGLPLSTLVGGLKQVAIFVCAVFLLRGANWARITYTVLVVLWAIGLLVTWYRVSGMGPIAVFTIVKNSVLLYVLFRPEADAYFASPADSVGTESPLPVKRPDA